MKQDDETQRLDATDARLLDRVQRGIPLDPRPFAVLGREIGIDEADCLARLKRLGPGLGIVRQISAIFDTQSLGYASSLVAAKVAPQHVDAAAAVINRHPGVSHNYLRGHAYNLWFTLALPPDSRLGLDATLARLVELSGAESARLLTTLRLFKIGVKLRIGSDGDDEATNAPQNMPPGASNQEASNDPAAFTEADRQTASAHALDDRDKRLILALQQNLPLATQPFDDWAKQANCSVVELLAAAQRFLDRRQMRRFSAVLRHRKAGYSANVMTVWDVPQTDIERVGRIMAKSAAVSHCYQRPVYPDWPYSLYTMVHGQSREHCLATLESLRNQTGLDRFLPLWSLHEYKKVRVRYFTPEIQAWEEQYGQVSSSS